MEQFAAIFLKINRTLSLFWRYKRKSLLSRSKMRRLTLSALLITLALPASVQADPTLQGSFGDWSVYSRYQGSQKTCYIYSSAKTKSPSNVRHGDIHFLVANWKSGAATEQPSFMADFNLRKERPPTVSIGGQKFDMYVSLNEGFIAEYSDERNLVNQMRAGSTMKVAAVSSRGTNVNYTFSLRGISAALDKASSACQ